MNDDYIFDVKRNRPEELYSNVADYYDEETLSWYATSKSIMKTQEKITIRALELLNPGDKKGIILDCGCGPGFSTIYLNELGYKTVAIDIIASFLSFYNIRELNPINADMCFPPFIENCFDAIISISALQWIYRDTNDQKMEANIIHLFKAFYSILKKESKAVIQFYPKNSAIMEEIGTLVSANTKFEGNFVIDNPNSPKKRKIYLILHKN